MTPFNKPTKPRSHQSSRQNHSLPATQTSFADFGFPAQLTRALEALSFIQATEVQRQTIPLIMEGRDILATAQTGTGKTAAFAIPLLARLMDHAEAPQPIRAQPNRILIVAPTRELAEQIGEVLKDLTATAKQNRYAVIIGGGPYGKQLRHLQMNPVFVVGTPGRLIDHAKGGALDLSEFGTLVLDEADRMLDMGFEPQVEELIKRLPKKRQTLMFSATLPPEVRALVSRYLNHPARVKIGDENKPVAKIHQDVIELKEEQKEETLIEQIDQYEGAVIIFTRTKIRAEFVAHCLREAGHKVEALHGDLNQRQRRRVTEAFRDQEVRLLVATDIASRGLDILHIRHVVNYDLPLLPEDYIHRIGRTGRAGAEGHSVAFVTPREKRHWYRILELIGKAPPRAERYNRERPKGKSTRWK